MEDGDRSEKELLREKERMLAEIIKARVAAEARVRPCLQRRMGDIRVYPINVRADVKAFRNLIKLRYNRMLDISSTTVNRKPVTPPIVKYDDDPELLDESDPRPEEDRSTFHIVELEEEGFDECVQTLYRESSLYFVAFRILDRHANRESTDGWYRFKNERLPSFLQSQPIFYDSDYDNISSIKVGAGSMLDIFHGLRKYTPNNAMVKGDQNERVLRAAALVFSEVQRLKSVQRDFMWSLANGVDRDLSQHVKQIHEWSGKGKKLFGGETVEPPQMELGDGSQNREENDVWIFKFNERLTPMFIVRQQKMIAMKAQETKP